MTPERIAEIESRRKAFREWDAMCGEGYQLLDEDVPALLEALREAQLRADDAEYWCKMIRRCEGDYQEPRDAYRTFGRLSERLQEAEKALGEAEQRGFQRGIEAAIALSQSQEGCHEQQGTPTEFAYDAACETITHRLQALLAATPPTPAEEGEDA